MIRPPLGVDMMMEKGMNSASEQKNALKTRKVDYRDGRCEVVQILDEGRMSTWTSNDPLAYEASIMWLTDISQLPFVRVLLIHNCENRGGRLVPRGGGRVVGYAKLTENAPVDPATGRFVRRVFYLREDDLKNGDFETAKGAVDPNTILPGLAGERPKADSKSVRKKKLVLPNEARGGARRSSDKMEDDVMGWLADAVAPTLSSVRKPESSEAPQSLIDTEVSHDVPDHQEGNRPARQQAKARFGTLSSMAGKSFPLHKPRITIGRDRECDLVIRQSNVSGLHCELTNDQGFWFVEDMCSTNGVRINGVRIPPQQKKPVDPGVMLSIGKHDFEIQYDPL